MDSVEAFLTATEERDIVNAIQLAEKSTSGEIRVHIEKTTEGDSFQRAKEVFYLLQMDKTKLKNGVLLYVATESRQFAIIGDEGINHKVGENFWNDEWLIVTQSFAQKQNALGIIKAIERIGEKLKIYFPYEKNDVDELPNEISKF